MKKILGTVFALAIMLSSVFALPQNILAAGGIYASGGKTVTVGQTFTVTVAASGATFDTIHGSISISGPVSVVSFSAGSATWISQPTNGGTFDGAFLGDKKTSFTVATIKLKGTAAGTGAVSTSGISLKNAGSVVGTGSNSTSFTIQKAPDLPGAVTVTSSTHPDPNQAYDATTIELSWNKESGVDGFSYLIDQSADTTPAATATNANTSVSYPDQAVGTYYFHIRAHKADGWGTTTNFQINIKKPDPKIDATLAKPSDIKIEKTNKFTNNIADGTVSNIRISGKTLANYTANFSLAPAQTLPEGKTLSAIADANGNFSLLIDYPISVGHYTLIIQGQKDLVLTPVSDKIIFEISQAKGGSINILTDADANAPVVKAEAPKKWYQKINFNKKSLSITIGIIALAAIVIVALILIKKKKVAKLLKMISKE